MQRDKKSYTILVIEDNEGDFTLVADFLAEQILNPVILRAKSYQQAKTILIEHQVKIQVVLLDLSLPDKSGEELITGTLELCQELPVIVLTGYSDISFGVKSLLMGVSDYLLKDELNATTLYKTIIYNLERKRILTNLQESERRYSELFHLSPQPMGVYDLNTLSFLDVNQAATGHYGYSYEEFMEMQFKDLFASKEYPLNQPQEDLLQQQSSTTGNGILHQKKSGERITVDIRTNDILFKGVQARVILINDVTERLQYINAIEKQNEKLKAIGWKQSHVVRAPLARIMGMINLISNDLVTEAELADLLIHIKDSAEEFDRIIKEIISQAEQVETAHEL